MTTQRKIVSLLAGAAMAFSGAVVQAAEYTLIISSWTPPTHGINTMMWPKFISMVEEATGGRVTAEVKMGLAPPNAQIDLVMDGAADIAFISHGNHPGRFATTKILELPGYDASAEAMSVVDWRVYEKFLKKADEHRGVKVLATYITPPSQLHTVDPVKDLAAISGLKIRAVGVAADVVSALGATGIQVPAPKVYETLASRAADGVMFATEARKGFRLTEVAKYLYEAPGGFGRSSLAYIMNESSFARLPADLQQALNEKVFGEPLSRELGRIWDELDQGGREVTVAASDNAVTVASPEDVAALGKSTQSVVDSVIAEASATGVDGAGAYAFVQSELSNYEAPDAGQGVLSSAASK